MTSQHHLVQFEDLTVGKRSVRDVEGTDCDSHQSSNLEEPKPESKQEETEEEEDEEVEDLLIPC